MATPATALTGNVGDSIFVRSQQVDAYGLASSTTVVWSTSAASVAIVQNVVGSNNAVISCLTAGTATITATMGAVTATFALTVITPAVNPGAKLVISAGAQPVNKTIQTKTS
jgi:hypothetical protein